MFSGIVEEAGRVKSVEHKLEAIRLRIEAAKCHEGLKIGDSLAVNGCCLTIVELRRDTALAELGFDLLEETWRKTNLQFVQPGSLVNLERPLRPESFVGGHFVTGHVDGLGTISRWEKVERDWVLEIDIPEELMRFAVYKGSIAVDGISLTIADLLPTGVRIWIIPHTFEVTNLRTRKVGDKVNLEMDLIGKYVERLLSLLEVPKR